MALTRAGEAKAAAAAKSRQPSKRPATTQKKRPVQASNEQVLRRKTADTAQESSEAEMIPIATSSSSMLLSFPSSLPGKEAPAQPEQLQATQIPPTQMQPDGFEEKRPIADAGNEEQPGQVPIQVAAQGQTHVQTTSQGPAPHQEPGAERAPTQARPPAKIPLKRPARHTYSHAATFAAILLIMVTTMAYYTYFKPKPPSPESLPAAHPESLPACMLFDPETSMLVKTDPKWCGFGLSGEHEEREKGIHEL